MQKIGVFDLDGTVYRDTLTFAVAEELLRQPSLQTSREQVAASKTVWKARNSVEAYWVYNKTMLEVFEELVRQASPAQMQAAAQKALEKTKTHCYAYTRELITKLKQESRVLIAMSGSIKDIVEPFAKDLGFDVVVASELEQKSGSYTGQRVSQTNKNKAELLQTVVKEHGLTMEDSIGIGDTHRDISLLAAVDNPIAFNPNAALYEEAMKQKWQVVIERKNMVYELSPDKNRYVVNSAYPSHPTEHHEELR